MPETMDEKQTQPQPAPTPSPASKAETFRMLARGWVVLMGVAWAGTLAQMLSFLGWMGPESVKIGHILLRPGALGVGAAAGVAPIVLVLKRLGSQMVYAKPGLGRMVRTTAYISIAALIAYGAYALYMAPALQSAYDLGLRPLINNEITAEQAFERSSEPLKAFMQKNVREKDLVLFADLSREPRPASPEEMSLRILVPAFMISELKRAFEIGFLLFLPFLIIDLVVASVLMSMGMMMLPPVVVSLPFKLIFFVLVDGWSLVAGSLVQSYGG